MELVGTALDTAGVSVMVIGAIIVTGSLSLQEAWRHDWRISPVSSGYGTIDLLGFEFLVAGDIIRTVMVHPSLDNVIVLIRTFPNLALQLEVEGRRPWQNHEPP